MTPEEISQIVAKIGERFRTFGGDRDPGNNPIAHAMKGRPLAFAANVSVEDVVRFVVGEAERSALERAATEAGRYGFSEDNSTPMAIARRIRALAETKGEPGT